MKTIKLYTDLQQSKKLLELGIDKNTADFCYQQFCEPNLDYSNEGNSSGKLFYPTEPSLRHRNPVGTKTYVNGKLTDIGGTLDSFKTGDIPCWSLASLFNVLPPYLFEFERGIDLNIYPNLNGNGWHCSYMPNNLEDMEKNKFKLITSEDSLVDACYEMILKLNELKLL